MMPAAGTSQSDSIVPFFLAGGEQTATEVAQRLVTFLRGAQHSLDLALYDFRLSDALKGMVAAALAERAAAGVAIRIAYDADKPVTPALVGGIDPAPAGTGTFVQALGYPWRRIGGLKLMHQKYIVRDAGQPYAQVWTGSTNFTDDAWTLQENIILQLASPQLAGYYAQDFADLWQRGHIEDTGAFDTQPVRLSYAGMPATVSVLFSPGHGPAIDYSIARHVAAAQRRVRICSMLLNSSALLSALSDVLRFGQATVDGIYDGTQMQSVLDQWQDVPHNRWKIRAIEDIVESADLVGKPSTPYSPTERHDFMHAKVLVVDDSVIAGSYNFSRSAELNAENILLIESAPLAEAFSHYIDHLVAKYRAVSVRLRG